NGTLTALPQPPEGSGDMTATAASADGSVVVGSWTSGAITRAFRWTSAGGTVLLPTFGGSPEYSTAAAVASDGSAVIGTARFPTGIQGFRWTQSGGAVGVGTYHDGTFSEGNAVSGDGTRIVGRADSASLTLFAFEWQNYLDPLTGYSQASGTAAYG